jgi:sulfate/thiosulfate transport system substrate-binding protein
MARRVGDGMSGTRPGLSRRAAMAGALGLGASGVGAGLAREARAETTLLNVSYDPTREFYREYNRLFAAQWKTKSGEQVAISTSNGGSGAQARSVIDGQPADVVTLALAYDIDALAARGLVAKDWATRLPDNATPTTSTIAFLVRSGNPKGLRDWGDLVKPGVSVITPNPKTSGGARWNYLAAYGWALRQPGGTEASAQDYLKRLLRQVPVLDTGARGATNSFVQRGLGDVLLAWENEALLARQDLGPGKFEVVYPSLTILAEPPVAVVDKVVDRKGTRKLAEAYLQALYTPEMQDLAARHYYRPRDAQVAAKYAQQFPAVKTFTIADLGGWSAVQARHFDDGGVFDHIYTPGQ